MRPIFCLLLLSGALLASASQCPTPLAVVEGMQNTDVMVELLTLQNASALPYEKANTTEDIVLLPTAGGAVRRARKLLQAKPCPMIFAPVCGTDGNTYSNDCVASAAGVEVASQGECPKAGAAAAATPCPLNYAPVCGKDGVTYGNECAAKAAGVEVASQGECAQPSSIPAAPKPCSKEYVPVCDALTNTTYPNKCVAESAGAQVSYQGECGRPEQQPCTREYVPVCGTDGKSYPNACVAGNAGVGVQHKGECNVEPVPTVKDDTAGSFSAPGGKAGALAVACPAILAPVCGLSGRTWDNDCVAKAGGDVVLCNGMCPCPDLVAELETQGGVLFVPVDDALLPLLTNLTADAGGEDWTEDDGVQKTVLSAHLALGAVAPTPVVSTDENGTIVSGTVDASGTPSVAEGNLVNGTSIRTEGAVFVRVDAQNNADGSLAWTITPAGGDSIPVLEVRKTPCTKFSVALIASPLIEA